MSDRRHLMPACGRTVHDPKTYEKLPDSGKVVEMDSFWYRRLGDGDVVEVTKAATVQKKPEEK